MPAVLLAVCIQQYTVLSSPLTGQEQLSFSVEQREDERGGDVDGDAPGPPAVTFEGDILITRKQFEDHYETPTGLDGGVAKDIHVSSFKLLL